MSELNAAQNTITAPTGSVDIGDAAAAGASLAFARADHQHAVPAPGVAPPAVAAAGSVGAATTPARSDHTHAGVASLNGSTGALFGVQEREFQADMMDPPTSADAAVNALAPVEASPTNSALSVAAMDSVIEEGRLWRTRTAPGATSFLFRVVGQPRTAPGVVNTVGLKIYKRRMQDNVAVSAWEGPTVQISDFTIEANAFFQQQVITVAFTNFATAVVADEEYQFQITRIAPAAGTNLTGDFLLEKVGIRYS